jgi:hypothetical protein
MESLFTMFLIFLAAITALLTYLLIPDIPVVTLAMASAVALAGGVWWHWTQFAVDYRTSTWQEQLRAYASWALLLVIILASYGFYVFGWSGGALQSYATQPQAIVRNAGRAASNFMNSASRAVSDAANTVRDATVSAANTVVSAGGNLGLTKPSNSSNTSNIRTSNFLV